MLNRRFLRNKVLQILYAHSAKTAGGVDVALNELQISVEKAQELFFFLLFTYGEVIKKADELIEIRRHKITASIEERMPDMRFVQNDLHKMLINHDNYRREISNRKFSWLKDREIITNLAKTILHSPDYKKYLESEPGFETDKKFLKYFFEIFLYNSEELYAALEERSIYWTNDIDFVIKKIGAFIDRIQEGHPETLVFPGVYKKEDDRTFARDLLIKAITGKKKNEQIIEKQIVNWDIERVTQTDRIVLLLAVTEVIGFPSIPVKVSINEYIEISKMYSSPKNAKFVNGVLDKTVNYMRENEMYKKIGRGLME